MELDNDARPEQSDNTKASLPHTWVDRGIHKYHDQVGKERPTAVDIQIEISYDVNNQTEPWRYRLSFPIEGDFRNFMRKAGYLQYEAVAYGGDSDSYITAEMAQQAAELKAKEIVKRYASYVEAGYQAKKYTLTIPVTPN